jgi:cytochrome b561
MRRSIRRCNSHTHDSGGRGAREQQRLCDVFDLAVSGRDTVIRSNWDNPDVPEPVYGPTAKILHWLTMALLVVQYAVGWIMPGVKRGMMPESLMNLHISIGAVILTLVLARFLWRLFHHVPHDPNLLRWQKLTSTSLHLLLYALVVVTALTGWVYASARGWSIAIFGIIPVPSLVAEGSTFGRSVGELHQILIWVLLAAIVMHVLAALVHVIIYRDRVMQRMLPRLAG